jgi:hypothetical protein
VVRGDRSNERKRYTIGHELGHYLNPWHKSENPAGFQCTAKNLAAEKYDKNDKFMKMESEANEFSAELLMPCDKIKSFLQRRRGADLAHVIELASLFEVSKEAMARKYTEQNSEEPTAIIFSKNGAIRYIKKHSDFPWLNVQYGDPIPIGSVSSSNKSPLGKVSSWSEVASETWVDSKSNLAVFEQTIAQMNGFRITLLMHEIEQAHDYDEDDEYDLDESWKPTLGQRR